MTIHKQCIKLKNIFIICIIKVLYLQKTMIDERIGFVKNFQISQEIKDSLSKTGNKIHFAKFTDTIIDMNCKIQHISSPMHYSHLFKCINSDNAKTSCLIKIIVHQKEYGNNMHCISSNENIEITIANLLANLVHSKETPHILLSIGHFYTNINTFINLDKNNVVSKESNNYSDFMNNYKQSKYYKNVSVLISEFPNRLNVKDFLINNYQKITPAHWKVFFFQILSCLAVIQSKYPSFKHNNLKLDNVYVNKNPTNKSLFTYEICNNTFKVPNIGYQLLLSNYEFSNISEIAENQIVTKEWANDCGINGYQNHYHDMHYFFSTLLIEQFFPSFLTNEHVPQDAKNFVSRIVPIEYCKGNKNVSDIGRLLVDVEYVTPKNVLFYDQYFEEFRNDTTTNISKFLIPSGWKLSDDNEKHNNDVCPISLDKIMEYYCKCEKCNNVYNFDMFLSWFEKNKTCPICRSDWNNKNVYKIKLK